MLLAATKAFLVCTPPPLSPEWLNAESSRHVLGNLGGDRTGDGSLLAVLYALIYAYARICSSLVQSFSSLNDCINPMQRNLQTISEGLVNFNLPPTLLKITLALGFYCMVHVSEMN